MGSSYRELLESPGKCNRFSPLYEGDGEARLAELKLLVELTSSVSLYRQSTDCSPPVNQENHNRQNSYLLFSEKPTYTFIIIIYTYIHRLAHLLLRIFISSHDTRMHLNLYLHIVITTTKFVKLFLIKYNTLVTKGERMKFCRRDIKNY